MEKDGYHWCCVLVGDWDLFNSNIRQNMLPQRESGRELWLTVQTRPYVWGLFPLWLVDLRAL
jgi:hypothetical protein